MRAEILKFHDSNMARQEWNWTCFLDRCENGSFSLTFKQELIGLPIHHRCKDTLRLVSLGWQHGFQILQLTAMKPQIARR